MGGELSKREGVLLRSFQSEARSFCCFFYRFTQTYAVITISLLDIGFKWCLMIFFICFERVLLAMRGCTCSLRGCSRTLKTPNSPPLFIIMDSLRSYTKAYLPSVKNRTGSFQRGLTRAPLGGGGYFEPPPLVFLRYLLNQCRFHHQTCSTLSPNNFTHCVKLLKSRVL